MAMASIVPRVELSLGGSTRVLRCDFQALWLIEQASGEPAQTVCRRVHQAFAERKNPKLADVRLLLWALLATSDESLTLTQVGSWGSLQNLPKLARAVFEAISASAPMADDEPAAASESAATQSVDSKVKPTNWAQMYATARRHYRVRNEAEFWRLTWREWTAMTEVYERAQDRIDWRNGLRLAFMANRRRDPMKQPVAFEPEDFMARGSRIKRARPLRPKQTYEEQKAILLWAASQHKAFEQQKAQSAVQ